MFNILKNRYKFSSFIWKNKIKHAKLQNIISGSFVRKWKYEIHFLTYSWRFNFSAKLCGKQHNNSGWAPSACAQDFTHCTVWRARGAKTLGCLFIHCVHYGDIFAILVDCYYQTWKVMQVKILDTMVSSDMKLVNEVGFEMRYNIC